MRVRDREQFGESVECQAEAGGNVDGSPTLAAGVRSTPAAKVGLAAGSPLDLGMVSCIHRQ